MASRILDKIRARVRSRQYVMTLHAEEEMEEDGFEIYDVEHALLTGTIIGRQTDRRTKERKYLIRGRSVDDDRDAVVLVKLGPIDLLVIVTVYADES